MNTFNHITEYNIWKIKIIFGYFQKDNTNMSNKVKDIYIEIFLVGTLVGGRGHWTYILK